MCTRTEKVLLLRRQPHPATRVIAPVNVGLTQKRERERKEKSQKRKLKSLEYLRFSPEINTQRKDS